MLRNLKQFNLSDVEEKVLIFWRGNHIFEKTVGEERSKRPKFIFYEGPPYANGRPGIHHVLARVFKDIVLRYKTMNGFYVPRRAGWDTHGLPVEIEAEKQLGIKSKKEIEKFGLALFNQKARESIWTYKDEFERMTERIGYWLDLKNAYITYENDYIESLWWIISEISNKKLLRKDYKVLPYCPRCQTVLASHELGMPGAYKKAKDPSIYVKFKIKKTSKMLYVKGQMSPKDEYLLVWTTTPWTLPANVGIAVNTKLTYTKYKLGNEYIWSHVPPPEIDGTSAEVVEKISGKKLVGLQYEPLYKNQESRITNKEFFKVYSADFVSSEEGTGFVHIAPAFGEDDFNLIKGEASGKSWISKNKSNFEFPITIDDDGKVIEGFPGAGKFAKSADKDIIADLEERKLIHKQDIIEHDYPFCWRCSAPLLYFARVAWFIEMSKLRKQLIAVNKKINWIPEHIKNGRFGEWIKEAKDWAISRQRFWGTPLPIWECEKCDERFVAGSLDDLDSRAYYKNTFFLLRHTEAEHNKTNIIASGAGNKNVALTPKGERDAIQLAKKLEGKVDVIYASPYKRTQDLAKMIAKKSGIDVLTDQRIEEIKVGIFSGKKVNEFKKYFKSPIEKFTKSPPEGENLNNVKRRMFGFISEVNKAHNGKKILIISHGDPLWILEGAMKNFTNEEILSLDYIKTGELRNVVFHNSPYDKDGNLDMHRPFIDEVILKCRKCSGKMVRVKEIADVWFDSGAMPFASAHFPFSERTVKREIGILKYLNISSSPNLDYPADFISEGIDQTRGWFYTLLAVSVLLGYREPPFKNVICLELINDKYGQKMSKSKGNVLDPWEIIKKHGIDSVRWYFYTINPPGEPKNFDEADVKKVINRVINIVYNSFVFYETYGEKNSKFQIPNSKINVLDKWIIARLNQTVQNMTEKLEKYDIASAAKSLGELIDDLSRWYIRRSRRRLQKPENMEDYENCSATLGYVLLEISKLMAPFMPFFAEALYQSLNIESEISNLASEIPNSKFQTQISVHLEDWPKVSNNQIDNDLISQMSWVRDMATKALAKRAEAGIKVRQPIAELRIKNNELRIMNNELLDILKDEINVKEIILDPEIGEEVEIDTKITPELREEGIVREFARMIQELRQKAGLQPKDKIQIFFDASAFNDILLRHEAELLAQVGALKLFQKRTDKFNVEIETKIEGSNLWLAIKKV